MCVFVLFQATERLRDWETESQIQSQRVFDTTCERLPRRGRMDERGERKGKNNQIKKKRRAKAEEKGMEIAISNAVND